VPLREATERIDFAPVCLPAQSQTGAGEKGMNQTRLEVIDLRFTPSVFRGRDLGGAARVCASAGQRRRAPRCAEVPEKIWSEGISLL
jgi:hypothetical protein